MLAFFHAIRQKSISLNWFITIVALYQATILNFAYYQKVLDRLVIENLNDLLFFLSMPIVVFCVIYLFLNLLIFRLLIKIVALLLVMIGAPLAYFMHNFSIMIDRSILQNALETNLAESGSLITPLLLLYMFFLGILPALLLLWVKISPVRRWKMYLLRDLASMIIAVLLIFSIGASFYKDYATFMRNNSGIIKYLLPSNYISAIYSQYKTIQLQQQPFITLGAEAKKQQRPVGSKKNVVILVVGETARAQNFSLYGYGKVTNPLLAQQPIITFKDTSSCGTYTAFSVPCMFSAMTRANYDANQANRQSNILDILQAMQVNIQWRDNDGGCKEVCNRVPYVNFNNQSVASLCNSEGTCYDEILFTDLDKVIESLDSDSLIVLHTIGSHGPTYYQRYPDRFKRFTPTCDTKQINDCSREALVNTYDNTILYTDYILDKTIKLLQNYDDRFNTAMIYYSDHGESLGEKGLYLHSMPYSLAPPEQTQIPFIMWLSNGFLQQQKIDSSCLTKQAEQKTFSHDNLFHTLLSMFNIESQLYDPALDTFNGCRIDSSSQG